MISFKPIKKILLLLILSFKASATTQINYGEVGRIYIQSNASFSLFTGSEDVLWSSIHLCAESTLAMPNWTISVDGELFSGNVLTMVGQATNQPLVVSARINSGIPITSKADFISSEDGLERAINENSRGWNECNESASGVGSIVIDFEAELDDVIEDTYNANLSISIDLIE